MKNGRFISKAMTMTVDTGATGLIDAVNDRAVIDVFDLTGISVYLNQIVDAGTVLLLIEKTVDGVNWAEVGAAVAETAFTAGANKAEEFSLSDANGMPLSAKQIRVTATALAGGGTYSFAVAGTQRDGHR